MKYGLLILCVFLISIGQVLFKLVAVTGEGSFSAKLLNPMFLLALAVYMIATLLWVWVLQSIPLSIAYPFMGLAFIMVPVMSYYVVGESMNINILFGGCLIMVGMYVATK